METYLKPYSNVLSMFNINSGYGNYWKGRELRFTRHASRELLVEDLDIHDVVEAMDDAIKCPNSRRRRGNYECCTEINGTKYKIAIADDVIRDLNFEPCWTVKHVKPDNWEDN